MASDGERLRPSLNLRIPAPIVPRYGEVPALWNKVPPAAAKKAARTVAAFKRAYQSHQRDLTSIPRK